MVCENIKYPYIIFKLANSFYCVNSSHVSTIVQLPHLDKIPAAPANVAGMFRYRDRVIQVLDLRITFGFKSMAEEYHEFEDMIEARKQDHIRWVNELERAVMAGEKFTLGKDPHQCAFGQWYDRFTSENSMINFHLRKIDEPHQKLHAAAHEIENCQGGSDGVCQAGECQRAILDQVKNHYMPAVLQLLDETKNVFQNSMYREMVLLLDGTKWGIAVDEIIGVEELTVIDQREKNLVGQTSFVLNVLERDKQDGLIFELNIDALSGKMKEYEKLL